MEPRLSLQTQAKPVPFIGQSAAAQKIRNFAARAAHTNLTVLLRGETGAGKDQIAAYIHQQERSNQPFVRVNCSSLAPPLFESELFGHAAGSFTDARHAKPGLLEVAAKGTVFVNEIANMGLDVQAKFLEVLDTREFRAVGSVKDVPLRARIIAATNANLEQKMKEGAFRPDLFHRLNVLSCFIPPLRERAEDIPLLVNHFLESETRRTEITPEGLSFLLEHSWPGNVRELQIAVQRAAFHADGVIHPQHIVPYLARLEWESAPAEGDNRFPTLEENERQYFERLLRYCRGNISKAASIAGIARQSAHKKLHRYGLATKRLKSF